MLSAPVVTLDTVVYAFAGLALIWFGKEMLGVRDLAQKLSLELGGLKAEVLLLRDELDSLSIHMRRNDHHGRDQTESR